MTVTEEIRPGRTFHTGTKVVNDWKDVTIGVDIPALSKLEGRFIELVRRYQLDTYARELRCVQRKPIRAGSSHRTGTSSVLWRASE